MNEVGIGPLAVGLIGGLFGPSSYSCLDTFSVPSTAGGSLDPAVSDQAFVPLGALGGLVIHVVALSWTNAVGGIWLSLLLFLPTLLRKSLAIRGRC
jgi:hypothetical protein